MPEEIKDQVKIDKQSKSIKDKYAAGLIIKNKKTEQKTFATPMGDTKIKYTQKTQHANGMRKSSLIGMSKNGKKMFGREK